MQGPCPSYAGKHSCAVVPALFARPALLRNAYPGYQTDNSFFTPVKSGIAADVK
jgi:hypothetical protein